MFCNSDRGLVGIIYVFNCLSVFDIIPYFGHRVHHFEFPCYSRSAESGALERRSSSGALLYFVVVRRTASAACILQGAK
jgi:hypothetical protein